MKTETPNGTYILTDSRTLYHPNIWGTVENETPVGIALIEGDKKLVVALKSSPERLIWLNDYERTSKSPISGWEEAKKDVDGTKNMELLLEAGSPAAKYCNEYTCGHITSGNWYLPALGELVMMQKHKNMIDAALTICGGEPLHYSWHWSSTEHSSAGAWVLYWIGGDTYDDSKGDDNQVRPVSDFIL